MEERAATPPQNAKDEAQPLGDLPLADLDPDNDFEVAPPELLVACEEALTRLGVEFRPAQLPLRQKLNDTFTCGAPAAFVYQRGPTALRFNSRPIVTCQLALGLAHFERVLEQVAAAELHEPVAKVTHGGTYNCRKMSRFPTMVSEHSYGNAIDVHSFTLLSGRTISVKKGFGKLDAPATTPDARFLRTLAERLFDDGVFSVVLTPFFDGHHHDHFHLDQARYRVDGTRPSQQLPEALGAGTPQ